MKEKITLFDIILIFLALLLFSTNTKLFYYLNENWEAYGKFTFKHINAVAIESMVYALPFSAITALLLKQLNSNLTSYLIIVVWFAVIDGAGVHIFHNPELPSFSVYASWYFTVYTFSIIASVGMYRYLLGMHGSKAVETEVNNEETKKKKIIEMAAAFPGISQRMIAIVLDVSPGYVSRVLNEVREGK